MKIAVIGAGGWGTALSVLLNNNSHKVTLWSFEKDVVDNIIAFRENKNYLSGVTIPLEINITNSLSEIITENDIIVLSIPVQHLRSVLEKIKEFDLSKKIILNTAKGLEINDLLFPSQIILNTLKKVKKENVASISGPSHAEEVARNRPTNIVSASFSLSTAKKIKKLFSNNYFSLEISDDIMGVEVGAALKNIVAIGAGICDGLALGDNTKVGLLLKGLNQIADLGKKIGAKKETFYGLTGLGDLMVTCYSHHSRNWYVGEQIGKGRHLKDIVKSTNMIAEGVQTTRAAYQLLKKYKSHSSVIKEIYNVLYKHKSPHKAILDIMIG